MVRPTFSQAIIGHKKFIKKMNSNVIRRKLYNQIKNNKIKIGSCTENFGAKSKTKFQRLFNRKEKIEVNENGKYEKIYGRIELSKTSEVARLCIDAGCKKKAIVKINPVFLNHNRTPNFSNSYKKASEYNPSIVEIKITKLLTEKIVFKNYTPNITMYYTSFRCNDTTEIFKKNYGYNYLLKKKIIGPDIDVLIAEFVQGEDFYGYIKKYCRKDDMECFYKLKSLLFQVIITLAILQDAFEFVHYDLHGGNVLIDTTKTPGGYWEYNAFGKKFHVPNLGVQSKLWDFDFSATFKKEIIKNAKIFDGSFKKSGVVNKFNPWWDIFLFLGAIMDPSSSASRHVPNELIAFYNDIIPIDLRSGRNVPGRLWQGRILEPEKEALLTPREMLDHPFFADYTIKQTDIIKPIYKYPNSKKK